MNWEDWIHVANRVLLVLALLGGLSFITIYSLTRWWRSDVGRNMMTFVVSEVIILGLSVQVWLFGDFSWRQAFGIVAFAMFTAASWWRAVVLLRAQLGSKRSESEGNGNA